MKEPFLFVVFALVATAPVVLHAQDTAPLGRGNVSVKFGYVAFADDGEEDGGTFDGFYLGLEGYGRVAANLYLGAEVATFGTFNLFGGDELRLTPFEVNVKYARGVGSNFVVAGGAGLSYMYARYCETDLIFDSCDEIDARTDEETAWLFGGQIFGDFVYRIKRFDFGINAKYQLVQEFGEVAANFSNLRFGFQLGFIF